MRLVSIEAFLPHMEETKLTSFKKKKKTFFNHLHALRKTKVPKTTEKY